jgi:hypothetical protein
MDDNIIPFPKKPEKQTVLDWSVKYDDLFNFSFSLDDSPKFSFDSTDWIDRLELDLDLESLFRKIQSGVQENPHMRQFVIAQLTQIHKNLQKKD